MIILQIYFEIYLLPLNFFLFIILFIYYPLHLFIIILINLSPESCLFISSNLSSLVVHWSCLFI